MPPPGAGCAIGAMARVRGRRETPMTQPPKRLSDLKAKPDDANVYAPPSPRVARRKPAKVLTAAERAAFLATRPDLKP